ncbi:MAG: cyclodeaminase/cyclohydrolase family protein [Syntrophobacteraceae bacterium]
MGLSDLTVKEYVHKVAEGAAAPAGGSVCALACALSAALSLMTARLTLGNKKYSAVWREMEQLGQSMETLLSRSLELAEEDARAYGAVMEALKMGPGDKQRASRLEDAMKQAALVPMETLRTLAKITDLMAEVIEKGNRNCLCDAAVSIHLIGAAAAGTVNNLRANLSKIDDKNFTSRIQSEMTPMENNIEQALGRFKAFIGLLLSA